MINTLKRYNSKVNGGNKQNFKINITQQTSLLCEYNRLLLKTAVYAASFILSLEELDKTSWSIVRARFHFPFKRL